MKTDALTIQSARNAGLLLTGEDSAGHPQFQGTSNQWMEFWHNKELLKKTIDK